ncbi:MAG: hypothetical protein HOW73_47385 [Polyangiaceae bacterium]|nr:hypothetical protein [Polyangiaceae bacterium]
MENRKKHDLSEVAELLRLNRALDDQVRELVRTEQQLFLSQRDLGRQLGRLDALNRFAIEAAELATSEEILVRAADDFFRIFAYDQCAGFLTDGESMAAAAVAHSVPGREASSAERLVRVRDQQVEISADADPIADRADAVHARGGAASTLLGLCELMFEDESNPPTDRSWVLVLPLVRRRMPLGVMVFRRLAEKMSYHEELPSKNDLSFLSVFAKGLAGAIANARLVHDLKVSYDKLSNTQRELVERERLAALGEFAAIVAHEVRNPLGSIGNAVSVLRRVVTAPEATGLLDIVAEESARLNQIVSDLIDFARPNPPSFQLDGVARVVERAVEAARQSVPGGNVVLETMGDVPNIPLDARILRQAVVNLVMNALQASPPGTEVHVAISLEGERVRIDVTDQGDGIAADVQPRIFEPFFTTKATGTGLGLSVVKRAIDAHRGDVLVSSNPGEGTTFSIRLPMGRV